MEAGNSSFEGKKKEKKEKKKGKKLHFIMVIQKLTPHEDLQPAHLRWSVFTE